MAQYKLVYFNLRGRGEFIRYIFAVGGQKYEDFRFEYSDWPKVKPTTPFGRVPYLEVAEGENKFVLSQSLAIGRFLARKFDLAGKNEQEQAEADMYADQINEFGNDVISSFVEPNKEKRREMLKKLFSETIPYNLEIFEGKIAKSKSGFLLPGGLTWTDLYLYANLENLGKKKNDSLSSYSNLKIFDSSISNIPAIANVIKTRPVTNL